MPLPERDGSDAQQAVHEALRLYLGDDELAVGWCLTIDVAGPDDTRYLAHRAGGGHDGTNSPMIWTALGMMRASCQVAEEQLRESTTDTEDDD